jgi:hypothetical protein
MLNVNVFTPVTRALAFTTEPSFNHSKTSPELFATVAESVATEPAHCDTSFGCTVNTGVVTTVKAAAELVTGLPHAPVTVHV